MSKTLEKRKNERTRCLVPVEGKEGGAFDRTCTLDFSKGGLGFVSSHAIPVHKEIVIELDIEKERNPVFVRARIEWVHCDQSAHHYRVGVSFIGILGGPKSRLQNYFD